MSTVPSDPGIALSLSARRRSFYENDCISRVRMLELGPPTEESLNELFSKQKHGTLTRWNGS
jgi:hypothetical protein